jgi:hypothetical protein
MQHNMQHTWRFVLPPRALKEERKVTLREEREQLRLKLLEEERENAAAMKLQALKRGSTSRRRVRYVRVILLPYLFHYFSCLRPLRRSLLVDLLSDMCCSACAAHPLCACAVFVYVRLRVRVRECKCVFADIRTVLAAASIYLLIKGKRM